jgi:hypothetical protein
MCHSRCVTGRPAFPAARAERADRPLHQGTIRRLVEDAHGVGVEIERPGRELVLRIACGRGAADRPQHEAEIECRTSRRGQGLEGGRPGGRVPGVVGDEPARLRIAAALRHDESTDGGIDAEKGPVGLEDHLRGQVRIVHPDLGEARDADHEIVAGLVELLEPEAELGPRRVGGLGHDAQEIQELDVVEIGNAVELVEDRLGHPGMELDQRHPRIAVVEVRPFRGVARDAGRASSTRS